MKAWAYPTGEVYWELRRIFFFVYTGSKQSFRLSKTVKRHWPFWNDVFGKYQIDAGLMPSSKAAEHWGQQYLGHPRVRDEFSISSSAVLVISGFMAVSQLKKNRTEASGPLLLQILMPVLDFACPVTLAPARES